MSHASSSISIHQQQQDAINRIEALVLQLILRIANLEDPTLETKNVIPRGLFKRKVAYSTSSSITKSGGVGGGSSGAYTSARDLASMLRVLQSTHMLLQQNKTITQRELYYMHASYFLNQQEAGAALQRVQDLLRIPRHALGVLAASRGWVAGKCLRFQSEDNGGAGAGGKQQNRHRFIEDDLFGNTHDTPLLDESSAFLPMSSSSSSSFSSSSSCTIPRPIPSDIVYAPIPFQQDGTASCILVVEKECIFRRLVEDKIWDTLSTIPTSNNSTSSSAMASTATSSSTSSTSRDTNGGGCIVVTGCGFPDHATRALVQQLHQANPSLPIYGLSDYNPFGVAIMQCYTMGGTIPITWLGLRYEDLEEFQLPRSALQGFTHIDEAKAHAMLKSILHGGGGDDDGNNNHNNNGSRGAGGGGRGGSSSSSSSSAMIRESSSNTTFTSLRGENGESGEELILKECTYWLRYRCKMELEGLLSRGLSFLSENYLYIKIQRVVAKGAKRNGGS